LRIYKPNYILPGFAPPNINRTNDFRLRMAKCGMKCEVFSRVVGYMRPVIQWNAGKKEEYKERAEFSEQISMESRFATKGRPLGPLEKVAEH
jgi:ribonucleoside-triphosphate reductase